jgi:hypothetical protein
MAEKNRYVLREIEMEEAQHQTLLKLLSHIAARKGQLMLAMYLPSSSDVSRGRGEQNCIAANRPEIITSRSQFSATTQSGAAINCPSRL